METAIIEKLLETLKRVELYDLSGDQGLCCEVENTIKETEKFLEENATN